VIVIVGDDGPLVHVHLMGGMEVYLTPSGPECLNVALLTNKHGMAVMKGNLQDGYRQIIQSVPKVARLLEGATPLSEVQACGPLRVHPKSIVTETLRSGRVT
jgi:hypothetical protein